MSAHRGDVAQVDCEGARANRLRRTPSQIEMNIFDHAVDCKQRGSARPRNNRAIVADAEIRATAEMDSRGESRDQFEFAGELAGRDGQFPHGVRAFASTIGNSATSVSPRLPSA